MSESALNLHWALRTAGFKSGVNLLALMVGHIHYHFFIVEAPVSLVLAILVTMNAAGTLQTFETSEQLNISLPYFKILNDNRLETIILLKYVVPSLLFISFLL